MDPMITVLLMTGLMLLLLFFGVPIAFALAIAGSIGIIVLQGLGTLLYTLGTFPVSRVSTFTWIIIPLFILMGNFGEASGIAAEAYSMASKWLNRLKGGLVLVTIVTCGLIGATTGSGATGTAIMGKIAVPEMRKYGYDMKLATGATASAGTLGILIPPSGSFVIIGILAELSIGKLFIAGILPGILTILVYSIMVNVRCTLNPKLAPQMRSVSWKERLLSLRSAWGVVLVFVVVVGGLYTGIASVTSVATLGCFITLVMALFAIARRKSTWGRLKGSFIDATEVTAMIFAFIIGAGIFSVFVTLAGIIPTLLALVKTLTVNPLFIVIGILLIYVLLGMFFDPLSMVIVTVPVFFPIVVNGLGFNPIWFSVLVVKMVELGCITPPVGLNLFIMKGVFPEASLSDITKGCGYFMMTDIVTIAILIAFPLISTWLPGMMQA